MYKQVIVVNKSLNMSSGKLGAMVAHGATSFFCEWFKRNVITSNETYNDYLITPNARVAMVENQSNHPVQVGMEMKMSKTILSQYVPVS